MLELISVRFRLIDPTEILDHKRYYRPATLRRSSSEPDSRTSASSRSNSDSTSPRSPAHRSSPYGAKRRIRT